MRHLLAVAGLVAVLSSCTGSEDSVSNPDETLPPNTFRFSASTILGLGDENVPEIDFWDVKPTADYVYISLPARLATITTGLEDQIDANVITEQVTTSDGSWTRGMVPGLNPVYYGPEISPTTWYEVAYYPPPPFDPVQPIPTAAAFWAQLGLTPEATTMPQWNLEVIRAAVPSHAQYDELSELSGLTELASWAVRESEPNARIIIGEDDGGRVVKAKVEIGQNRFMISEELHFFDFGTPITEVQVTDPQPIRPVLNLPD